MQEKQTTPATKRLWAVRVGERWIELRVADKLKRIESKIKVVAKIRGGYRWGVLGGEFQLITEPDRKRIKMLKQVTVEGGKVIAVLSCIDFYHQTRIVWAKGEIAKPVELRHLEPLLKRAEWALRGAMREFK